VHTMEALKARNIEGLDVDRYPRPIEKVDFIRHDRIIALSEDEHRPMLEERFLAQCGKVEYFEVGDLPLEKPEQAMQKIADLVDDLVKELSVKTPREILCI